LIGGLSSSSEKHHTTASCVAVPVATVTSFNQPRACAVSTSGPRTSLCSSRPPPPPPPPGLTARIIRLDLTRSPHPPPSSSSSAAAAAASCDAGLNQRHQQHGEQFEKVSASTGCHRKITCDNDANPTRPTSVGIPTKMLNNSQYRTVVTYPPFAPVVGNYNVDSQHLAANFIVAENVIHILIKCNFDLI